jgi:sucrose phosphorylase
VTRPTVVPDGQADLSSSLLAHLVALYGEEKGRATLERLQRLLDRYPSPRPSSRRRQGGRAGGSAPAGDEGSRPISLTQRDAILITYPDQVHEPGRFPLQALARFCDKYLSDLVSGIHILPFYPSSSDDGFSVIDYRAVDPALGRWEDVARLGTRFRLMFDAVLNHTSAQSEWFQAFLRDDPIYRDYFIVVPDGADLSQVVRPRALPLLTRFVTPSGPKAVWTTFSADQIDLNYANPKVLLEIIDTLLFYVAHGAEFIRLDAIAYLWKEIGTPCIHLPQTHHIIQFLRAVLDAAAPHVALITETNVPHADNLSYFGDGTNEAQLVYNFALPPLVLHTFQTEDAEALCRWAASLSLPSKQVSFFNFLASHDGVGLNPARALLSEAQLEALVQKTLARDGLVSYGRRPGTPKHNPDGTQSPYELNINYFDALADPAGGESMAAQVDRFIAAQAIMLAFLGVPGIYFHSLFGSRGWPEGVRLTGRNRSINRQKCDRAGLELELGNPATLRRYIFTRYAQLLKARAASPAFDPHGEQQVAHEVCREAVFALWRISPGGNERVLCLHNVSRQPQQVELNLWPKARYTRTSQEENVTGLADLVSGRRLEAPLGPTLKIALAPYQVSWLKVES